MIPYRLVRWMENKQGIVGDLYRMDQLLCFTLEPPFQPKNGAIPEGSYVMTWEQSPRLGHYTPRLNNVPGREGILIHAGNVPADTEGCILVGSSFSMYDDRKPVLAGSRAARDVLYRYIEEDLNGGFAEITITSSKEA